MLYLYLYFIQFVLCNYDVLYLFIYIVHALFNSCLYKEICYLSVRINPILNSSTRYQTNFHSEIPYTGIYIYIEIPFGFSA